MQTTLKKRRIIKTF